MVADDDANVCAEEGINKQKLIGALKNFPRPYINHEAVAYAYVPADCTNTNVHR